MIASAVWDPGTCVNIGEREGGRIAEGGLGHFDHSVVQELREQREHWSDEILVSSYRALATTVMDQHKRLTSELLSAYSVVDFTDIGGATV